MRFRPRGSRKKKEQERRLVRLAVQIGKEASEHHRMMARCTDIFLAACQKWADEHPEAI